MSKGKWLTTTERRYIAEMYTNGALINEIARTLGKCETTISRQIARMNLPQRFARHASSPLKLGRYIDRRKHLTNEEVTRRFNYPPRPCPFCNSDGIEMHVGPRPYMVCLSCGAQGPVPEEQYRKRPMDARDSRAFWLWNQRHREGVRHASNPIPSEPTPPQDAHIYAGPIQHDLP